MKSVAIIGVGLIGGSWALALKKYFSDITILGVDNNQSHLEEALRLGLIDKAVDLDAAAQSDLVFVSIPVGAASGVLVSLLDKVGENTLIMDAGSTKSALCQSISDHPNRSHFLAAHPIAGTEFSGPTAAKADLFDGKLMILCEIEKTAIRLQENILTAFQKIGMRLRYMDPESHDKHVAYVSHLSHVSSFMLGKTVMDKEADDRNIFDLAGSGFASTVRLAKSSPEMWGPIFLQNKEHLSHTLEAYISNLQKFKTLIDNEDLEALTSEMKRINTIEKILNPLPLTP
ncbi:MAG: Prephenate dehydrogenase [Flavobacteriaceae bacterium]|jgi:prephenate dehydrogenase|nr:MAG: Prephenate dehydrogenase [Flavobacteriaceae bacterium]